MSVNELAQQLAQIDAADPIPEMDLLPGGGIGLTEREGEPTITPKMASIVAELQSDDGLLLVEPTLRWVQQKKGEMAMAKLRVLYTDEEIVAMRQALEERGG